MRTKVEKALVVLAVVAVVAVVAAGIWMVILTE
jgi:hypothetical protein